MATLKLCLFGQLQTFRGEQRLRALPSRKEQHLLCYLLLHRQRSHARSVLAGLFWGDSSEEQARKSLRTSLWRLRKFLEQDADPAETYLLVGSDDIGFNARSDYWLDVETFERSIAAAVRLGDAGASESALVSSLSSAVELYQGDLLEGCHEEWCLLERERLRGAFLHALATLLAYHRSRGAYDAAIRCGRRIVAHDPLLEEAHRELMELYRLSGNRAAALRQYHLCREVLARELGVEPAEPLRALYAQIIRQAETNGQGGRGRTAGRSLAARVATAGTDGAPPSPASQMDAILGRLQALQGEFRRNMESLETARRELERDLALRQKVLELAGSSRKGPAAISPTEQ